MFVRCSEPAYCVCNIPRFKEVEILKIGVTQIVLQDQSLEETLRLCQSAGYDVLELFFSEGGDPDINWDEDKIRAIGDQCKEAGIEVVSVLGWYEDRGSYLSQKPEVRAKAERSLARMVEIAGILQVDTVLLNPGALDPKGSYLRAWDQFVDDMKHMAQRAAEHNVVIGLENVWNQFILSPKEALDMVQAVDHPNFAIYLDTANMMLYGYPEHWIHDLGENIRMVHFKDFKRRERQFVDLMDGDTDWPAVIQGLRDIQYKGPVIHEIAGDATKQHEMARRMRHIVSL